MTRERSRNVNGKVSGRKQHELLRTISLCCKPNSGCQQHTQNASITFIHDSMRLFSRKMPTDLLYISFWIKETALPFTRTRLTQPLLSLQHQVSQSLVGKRCPRHRLLRKLEFTSTGGGGLSSWSPVRAQSIGYLVQCTSLTQLPSCLGPQHLARMLAPPLPPWAGLGPT